MKVHPDADDYGLDAQAEKIASIRGIFRAEEQLTEKLRTGKKRLRRAQTESATAPTDPTSAWQIDRHMKERGGWAQEWHF